MPLLSARPKNADNKQRSFIIPPKILVIEDDYIIQYVTTMALEDIGCKTEVAKDGLEAINMFKNNYDLILSDIGLPKMDGIEVAKAIRKFEQESDSKRNILIALTAFSENIRDQCISAGFDDFYVKPLESDALEDVIFRWVPHLVTSSKKNKISKLE